MHCQVISAQFVGKYTCPKEYYTLINKRGPMTCDAIPYPLKVGVAKGSANKQFTYS